jgi:hypothetical protein
MLLRFLSLEDMKIISLIAAVFLASGSLFAQNLVGYQYGQIRKYMKENHKDMNFTPVVNDKFRYLKYTDNSDSRTFLFFLDQDSVCKSVRLICDAETKAEKQKEYNSLYEKNGENKWISRREGKSYNIELKNEEWSCVITIEPGK